MLKIQTLSGEYRDATHQEILAAASHILASKVYGQKLESPRETIEFLKCRMGMLEHEVFCVLYLDNRHRVISFEEAFRGTINGTSVYPREIVKRALSLNAAAVIFTHNHPSGVAEPSRADESLTRLLMDALKMVEVRVLDHLVVTNGEVVSMSERGLI